MRIIIAGPRDLHPPTAEITQAVIHSNFPTPTAIVTGGASGVDTAAKNFAEFYGIQPIILPALWDYHRRKGFPKAAGPKRNKMMAEVGEALIVIKRKGIDTRGTSDMIKQAKAAGLPIYIHEIGEKK